MFLHFNLLALIVVSRFLMRKKMKKISFESLKLSARSIHIIFACLKLRRIEVSVLFNKFKDKVTVAIKMSSIFNQSIVASSHNVQTVSPLAFIERFTVKLISPNEFSSFHFYSPFSIAFLIFQSAASKAFSASLADLPVISITIPIILPLSLILLGLRFIIIFS